MLTQREAIILIETMRAMGQQIPCTYCYAENKRQALKQYFLNFIDSRNGVLNATNAKDARRAMYGKDNKGKLSKAAKEVYLKWRGDNPLNRYRPTINQLVSHYKQARNVILSDLDLYASAGKINTKMSDKAITNLLCNRYGIDTSTEASHEDKGRATSISNIVNEWRYDTIEGNKHKDFKEEDIHLCMLIRLKMNNTVVSNIYNIGVDAVKKRKLNLKKNGFKVSDSSIRLEDVIDNL
jgi:hypothetical protein